MVGVFAFGAAAFAQDVVSARAGLIHYLEGKVYLNDQAVDATPSTKLFSQFPEVKENQVLRTEEGRAEVLLSPGVVIRIGEDSSLRMISNRLVDTRVELVRGTAVLEVVDLLKENSVRVLVKDATVQPKRTGSYKMSTEPASLLADVLMNDATHVAKRGQSVTLEGEFVASKFDTERGDSLTRWSSRRSGYLAMANVSAAKGLLDSGYGWSNSGWLWNPYFGMFTFIPARGVACSAFSGFCYYSPQRVYSVIYRPVYGSGFGGGGYGRSRGYGGGTSMSSSSGLASGRMSSGSMGSMGGMRGGAISAAPSAPASTGAAHVGGGGTSMGGGGGASSGRGGR
jgi:hypothetical protein